MPLLPGGAWPLAGIGRSLVGPALLPAVVAIGSGEFTTTLVPVFTPAWLVSPVRRGWSARGINPYLSAKHRRWGAIERRWGAIDGGWINRAVVLVGLIPVPVCHRNGTAAQHQSECRGAEQQGRRCMSAKVLHETQTCGPRHRLTVRLVFYPFFTSGAGSEPEVRPCRRHAKRQSRPCSCPFPSTLPRYAGRARAVRRGSARGCRRA